MNLSGIDSRSLIGKVLRLPLKLVPNSAIIPIVQGPLRGKRWIAGSSNHGCWLGSYELSKQKVFMKYVNEGQTVYDIGAHVGFYTLLSSYLVGDHGRVVAFEPLPSNVEYVRRHIELNQIRNVTLFEKAVSDHSGQATFQVAISSYMGHLSSIESPDNTITIETVALDQLIDEQNLPIPNVIKVDIEGGEFSFLKGAKHLLEGNRITVFIATHGEVVHKQCVEFLQDINYEISSLSEEPLETTDEILAIKRS